MKRSISPNARKSLKLSGLSPRSSSTKHDWDSVGTIKFFTDKDDDISGLDEAMRNISMGAKQSTEANVQSSSLTDGKESTSCATFIDELSQQGKSIVEIAVEATTISESASLLDSVDSNESEKPVHRDDDESLGVFSFSNDLNMTSNMFPNAAFVSTAGDETTTFYMNESQDISLSKPTNHAAFSPKSNVNRNLIKTISLDDDSDVHSLSDVLPSSSTDFKSAPSTTVASNLDFYHSGSNSIAFNESSEKTSSIMGNQLDSQGSISHDLIKSPTNINNDKTKKISDPNYPSSLVGSITPSLSTRMKSDSSSSTFMSNKVTEPSYVGISNIDNSKFISSNHPSFLLESTEIKQRRIGTTNTILEPTSVGVSSKQEPRKTSKSKLHRLPLKNK
ncbi:unnamed protein product [Heterobilharzia americana]|nr:unnamed protein product [Heterobilharzia americana]